MPQKIKHKRTAQRSRKGINGRKNDTGNGRQAGRTKKEASRVIANSIFALTLLPKPSLEVLNKTGGSGWSYSGQRDDDYYQMYEELFQAYRAGIKIVTGEPTFMDPLKEGFDIGFALSYVMNGFKNNILPKGFDFNIDRGHDGSYYFSIYSVCPFPEYWHCFEVAPVLRRLRKINKKLHDTFIIFLSCFMKHTGISGWWNGGMGYAEYQLEEELNAWDEYHTDDDTDEDAEGSNNANYNAAVETYESYKNGEAHEYAVLIKKTKAISTEHLLKKLQRFNSRNPLVVWMKEVCDFMKMPYCVQDFYYDEIMEDGEGLEFDQQVSIVWDFDDAYSSCQKSSIDSVASCCGVYPPIASIALTDVSKELDLDWLKNAAAWTEKLTNLYDSFNSILNKSYKKIKDHE